MDIFLKSDLQNLVHIYLDIMILEKVSVLNDLPCSYWLYIFVCGLQNAVIDRQYDVVLYSTCLSMISVRIGTYIQNALIFLKFSEKNIKPIVRYSL